MDMLFSECNTCIVPRLSLEEYARYRKAEGATVIKKYNYWWEQVFKGFYRPLNYLEPVTSCPNHFWNIGAVGFQAHNPTSNTANTFPVHLLEEVAGYTFESQKKSTKQKIKKALEIAYIAPISEINVIAKAGYEIQRSAFGRTGRSFQENPQEYERKISHLLNKDRALVLGAFHRETKELLGYMIGWAVNNYGYISEVNINSEYMQSDINRLLILSIVKAFQELGDIKAISMGLHFRERPGIVEFKRRMGFPTVHLPSIVQINPLIRFLLKRKYPDKLYRLEGGESN
jgi:hypothetical protein